MIKLKRTTGLLVVFLTVSAGLAGSTIIADVSAQELDDINVIQLIASSCGWNYFDVKELLESWGVTVTTVSYTVTYDVSSCFNKEEQRDITADILLQDFDNTTFSEYDAVILPSGGHWGNLAGRPLVNEFLSDAYEAGLVIASICIAGKTLAQSGIIPEGTKVCTHSMANPDMNSAGAVITYERTVSHNRIITGGGGSGVPNGYESAPTYEVCREVIKAVRGLSGIQDIILESTLEENRTYYQLSARLFNLTLALPEIEFENVSRIMAHIYEPDNEDPISSVELQDAEDNGTYSAAFYLSEPNEYTINIEIESDGNVVEVIQEAATAIIETRRSGVDMTVIAGVVCILAVAGVVVLIVKRRP